MELVLNYFNSFNTSVCFSYCFVNYKSILKIDMVSIYCTIKHIFKKLNINIV